MYCPSCLPEGPSAGDDPRNPRTGMDQYQIVSGPHKGENANLRPKPNGFYECPRCGWTNSPTGPKKAKG